MKAGPRTTHPGGQFKGGDIPSYDTGYIHALHTHSLGIVESIPENLTYPSGSPSHLSTYDAWTRLLVAAKETVDIASFYWTLRGHGSNSDSTDWQVGQ